MVKVTRSKNPGTISCHAIEAINKFEIEPIGIDNEPKQLVDIMLKESGIIIALSKEEHEKMIEERFPLYVDLVRFWDVGDVGDEDPIKAMTKVKEYTIELVRRFGGNI